MKYPILYHKASTGKFQQWEIWTDGHAIFTQYGQMGGKLQTSFRVATTKNDDKSNATTAPEQAVLEATAMWKFKNDRKYFETIEDAEKTPLMLPMLAHSWDKHAKKYASDATAKWSIQPKLDGVRALAVKENGKVRLVSRGGKFYTVPHIQEYLKDILPDDVVLDGEIYSHGMDFQKISGAVKKIQNTTSQLKFWVYDMADENLTWIERWRAYEQLLFEHTEESSPIVLTPTHNMSGPLKPEDLESIHDEFVEQQFEGMILRNHKLPYRFGFRSNMLLKYKKFEDAEFKVIGYTNGKGKFSGCVIWVCENDLDPTKTFQVVPKATHEEKEQLLLIADEFIGKKMTVTFFGRSDEGIPRFPVGKTFRISEDIDG